MKRLVYCFILILNLFIATSIFYGSESNSSPVNSTNFHNYAIGLGISLIQYEMDGYAELGLNPYLSTYLDVHFMFTNALYIDFGMNVFFWGHGINDGLFTGLNLGMNFSATNTNYGFNGALNLGYRWKLFDIFGITDFFVEPVLSGRYTYFVNTASGEPSFAARIRLGFLLDNHIGEKISNLSSNSKQLPEIIRPPLDGWRIAGETGAGLGLGLLGAAIAGGINMVIPSTGLFITSVITLSTVGVFTGVLWVGNMGDETGSVFWTVVGGVGGGALGAVGGAALFWGIIQYHLAPMAGAMVGFPVGFVAGAVIGFNLSRQYKEGVAVPPVSVNAYPVQCGAVTKTDVVTTVNILNFGF